MFCAFQSIASLFRVVDVILLYLCCFLIMHHIQVRSDLFHFYEALFSLMKYVLCVVEPNLFMFRGFVDITT